KRGSARVRPARAGGPAQRQGAALFLWEPEAAHRPVHCRDADVHAARRRYTRAQLCEGEVVLRTKPAGHQRQGCRAEPAALAASGSSSRESAGPPTSAQPLLDKGHADVELTGELTPRGHPCVAGWGDLGT